MTLVDNARAVLNDVRLVRQRLEDATDENEWRLNWVLALVLLRTVGDVLHKVHSAENAEIAAVARDLYSEWRTGDANAIFRDFIKCERDSIVHEYSTAISEGPVPLGFGLDPSDPNDLEDLEWLHENLYRPMEAGRFIGEDGRELIDTAVKWWVQQLDEVDQRVAKLGSREP